MMSSQISSGSDRKASYASLSNSKSSLKNGASSVSPLSPLNNDVMKQKNGYHSINIPIQEFTLSTNIDAKSKTDLITKETTHPLPSSGKSTICGVFWNMINALIGAGILAIPFVYTQCGLLGGILLIFIFGILCTYTLNLMIETAQIYQVSEYEDLGHKAIGTFGYILTSMCLFLEDYGTMLNYLIILGDSAFKVAQIWGFNSYHDRQLIIIIVSMVIIFPPCLWRDIALYQTFSAFKFLAIGIVVTVVIYQYFLYRVYMVHSDEGYTNQLMPESDSIVLFNINGFPSSLGIIAYCFACHDTAFRYYNTLFNPTRLRWILLILLSMGSAMGLSLLLSIPAYLTFGNNVEGNVLNNYSINDVSIIVVRIVYVIAMALTYPTGFFVVRHIVYANCNRLISLIKIYKYSRKRRRKMHFHGPLGINDTNRSNSVSLEDDVAEYSQYLFKSEYNIKTAPLYQHLIFTFIIFFSNLGLALFIDNLGTAMAIIGSLSSVNLAFVLPCISHINGSQYNFVSFITERRLNDKFKAWITIYPPLFIAMFGIFIAVYGVYETVLNQ